MMNDSGIKGEFCEGLWAECASTATYYENIIINKDKKRSPIELMFNEKVKGLRRFKRFGEMCVETTKVKIQSKLRDKGTACIFVGYAINHADDVNRLLNPRTKCIIKSRDVIWLGKSYGEWSRTKEDSILKDHDSDAENEVLEGKSAKELTQSDDSNKEKMKKALRETSILKSWFNPKPTKFRIEF
jgi:hypothetical protein